MLVSHLHYDHLDLPSLARLGRGQRLVARPGRSAAAKRGFAHVDELARDDALDIGGVQIRATTPSTTGRGSRSAPTVPAVGYLVSGSVRVYFAGDTDLFDGMSALAPGLDVALLPVAGWGPARAGGHLDPHRAAQALALLRPRLAVPIHWGTYLRIGLARRAGARPTSSSGTRGSSRRRSRSSCSRWAAAASSRPCRPPSRPRTGSGMTSVVDAATPFNDESRPRRLGKVVAWLGGIALVVLVLQLLGVDVRGWISSFWDALTEVSIGYIVAGLALQTVQTTLTALAWLFILRAGYPQAEIPYRSILAAYAAGVAMNGFLPANIGTFASLLMYAALIQGSTFPGILGAMVVQKIFFTIAGTFVYLYLFLSVPGSFSLQLGWFEAHRALAVVLIGGGIFMLVLLVRVFWKKLQGLWEKAKQGGAILAHPRAYLVRVVLPSFGAWSAKLGVIAVFLAAYGIPVTFHTVMSVTGATRSRTPCPRPPAASASTRRSTRRR